MKPSRRDSNRTKNDFLKLAASNCKKNGMSEEFFVLQFTVEYQGAARKAYQEAK